MILTEAILKDLGPTLAVMAVLIIIVLAMLRNQTQSSDKTIQAFMDAMREIAGRMDTTINVIAQITSAVNQSIMDSENRIQTTLGEQRKAINDLTSQCYASQANNTVQDAVKHTDARLRHDDDRDRHNDAVTANAKPTPVVIGGTP